MPSKAMIHLSMTVLINVFGERVEKWFGDASYIISSRTNAIPNVNCVLDGAPFVFFGLKREYRLTMFPFVDNLADPLVTTAYLVPHVGHTPDFTLEHIIIGSEFLERHIHSINPGLMEVTFRNTMGHLIRKHYQLRFKMRG